MEFFKNLIYYHKYNRLLKKIDKEEHFISGLEQLLNVQFETGWFNRKYTVINPYVQNIEDGGNTIIYDGNNIPQVEKWLMDRMNVVSMFIQNEQMFDIISYKLEKIDDDQNYLLILQNALFDWWWKVVKKGMWVVGGLGVVAIILLIILL